MTLKKIKRTTVAVFTASLFSFLLWNCEDNYDFVNEEGVEMNESSLKAYPYYDSYAAVNLPTPPNGKKWQFLPAYSDEFHGPNLDFNKWDNQIPTWKGRAPGFFVANNVSIADDKLVLKNTWLDNPIWVNGKKYTIGCAAVRSKASTLIYPCYTEVKMKASDVPLSSTFWLMGGNSVKYPNESNCRFRYTTELDVIETVGGPYSWDNDIETFKTKLKSNTHFRTRPCGGGNETFYSKSQESKPLGYKTTSGFHTYGVYWVNANKCHIYADHRYFYTINFDSSKKTNPFNIPMGLRMVTETYDWLTPPSKGMLKNNPGKTKTYYEFVRTYKLVNR